MTSRNIQVSKKHLESACQKILSIKEERIKDFDRRLRQQKEIDCAKTMTRKKWLLFGPNVSREEAADFWQKSWDTFDPKELKTPVGELAKFAISNMRNWETLKAEELALKNDIELNTAWRLQKLAIATHGPVLIINQDDFRVMAPYIEEIP